MTKSRRRRKYDWEAIEREYRAGQMTVRELSAAFGTPRGTIASRAKRKGWERDLSGKVKQAADAQLLKDSGASADSDADSEHDLVRTAAARVVEIIRQHRGTLGQLHETSKKLLGLVTRYADIAEKQSKAKTDAAREKFNAEMASLRTAFGETPIAAINKLTAAVERIVNLERKAFNIEDKDRTPDDSVPLVDRLKELQRSRAIEDSENVEELKRSA